MKRYRFPSLSISENTVKKQVINWPNLELNGRYHFYCPQSARSQSEEFYLTRQKESSALCIRKKNLVHADDATMTELIECTSNLTIYI